MVLLVALYLKIITIYGALAEIWENSFPYSVRAITVPLMMYYRFCSLQLTLMACQRIFIGTYACYFGFGRNETGTLRKRPLILVNCSVMWSVMTEVIKLGNNAVNKDQLMMEKLREFRGNDRIGLEL